VDLTPGDASNCTSLPLGQVALEAWKAARRDYAASQRRIWTTGVVLGPLSFVGLGLLGRTACPQLVDYAALGGGSMAIMLLWIYLGERGQAERERAGEELRAAEAALGQRAMAIDGGSSDRMVRTILAVFLLSLWAWTWAVRPDCTLPDEETSDLTAYGAPASTGANPATILGSAAR
jgi:hypothetical protein